MCGCRPATWWSCHDRASSATGATMTPRSSQATFERIVSILRRRWGLALVGFAVPLTAAIALAIFLPGLYQARAVVLVEPPIVPVADAEDTEGRLHKVTQENLSRAHLLALMDAVDLYPDERRAGADAAIDAIRRDATVEEQKIERPGGKSSIGVDIHFRGRNPKKVAAAANALASYYVDAEREHWQTQVRAVVAELGEAGKHLADQEARIAEFQNQHLGELPQQVAVHLATIGSLHEQLDTIRRNRVEAVEHSRSAGRPAPSAAPDPIAARADSPEARLERPEQTYRDLQTRCTSEHPDLIRVDQEIQALKKQIAAQPHRDPASA